VNIQHLESLYDKVESLVGIKVRERLPDSVVMEADQVVNVDLSEEDLLKRLEEGRIYPSSRIPQAMSNYFQASRLEHLRELALRELAQRIDQRRREETGEVQVSQGVSERVVVGISGKSESLRLLRHASRLAGRLSRDWYAVHVETPDWRRESLSSQRVRSDVLALAGQLGATVFALKGEDVAGTLLSFAAEYGVGHLVVGKPRPRPWWLRWFSTTVAQALLHRARGVSIDVVDLSERSTEPPARTESVPDGIEGMLASAPIVRWDRSVSRQEAMESLVQACVGSEDPLRLWEALEAVRTREEAGSTFLPDGIAIPHGRLANLPRPLCAIGVAREGVPDAPVDQPVELVFLLLTPLEDAKLHLKLMSSGVRILRDKDLRRRMLAAHDLDAARKILREAMEIKA
jgi:two-component system sensor histidine kinase KdpD